MTEEDNKKDEDNNNDEDYSSMVIRKSKGTSQNKELLKVLKALESQGFRHFDYDEN